MLVQLGTLALKEGDLDEAEQRYRAALALFQQLREPAMEAVAVASTWARFSRKPSSGMRPSGTTGSRRASRNSKATWWARPELGTSLAIVSESAGKPAAAEQWYRKAIEGFKSVGDKVELPPSASATSPTSCKISPAGWPRRGNWRRRRWPFSKPWTPARRRFGMTYHILAEIAEQEAATAADDRLKTECQAQARDYRRRARDAKRNFPGTRHKLRRYAELIAVTVAACAGQPKARERVADYQAAMRQAGPVWPKLAAVLDRVFAGERDADALCESIHPDLAMIRRSHLARPGRSDHAR